jgi:hypothetical protein
LQEGLRRLSEDRDDQRETASTDSASGDSGSDRAPARGAGLDGSEAGELFGQTPGERVGGSPARGGDDGLDRLYRRMLDTDESDEAGSDPRADAADSDASGSGSASASKPGPGGPGTPSDADLGAVLRDTSPDAVLLYGEMDRIAEPTLLLKTIRDNVLPGTLVFVNASCADGLEYEILGAESPSFVPLDRMNVFSLRGFGTLARSCGYKTVETSTPGRLDAIILQRYFTEIESSDVPFWSGFFRDANKDRLRDLQILLQRSLRSGVMRFVLET